MPKKRKENLESRPTCPDEEKARLNLRGGGPGKEFRQVPDQDLLVVLIHVLHRIIGWRFRIQLPKHNFLHGLRCRKWSWIFGILVTRFIKHPDNCLLETLARYIGTCAVDGLCQFTRVEVDKRVDLCLWIEYQKNRKLDANVNIGKQ